MRGVLHQGPHSVIIIIRGPIQASSGVLSPTAEEEEEEKEEKEGAIYNRCPLKPAPCTLKPQQEEEEKLVATGLSQKNGWGSRYRGKEEKGEGGCPLPASCFRLLVAGGG